MLTMTHDAVTVVRKFTANPRIDESSGVRIAEKASESQLQVRAVRSPQPGDVVIEQSGGRVYLEPVAADRVQGRVLDVRQDVHGRVEFLLKAA